MKSTKQMCLIAVAVFAPLAIPAGLTALGSATWYVNGVNGSDSNNCMSSQTACKTIGHAISLASSGDTVMVSAATYLEHLGIGLNLTIIGSGAQTTIIDGGHSGRVVTISNASANVSLSNLTIRNGYAVGVGGGIYNMGTLTINRSSLSGNSVIPPSYHTIRSSGGGISNGGTLTINNSTLSGNTAPNGGGIFNNGGTLTISNSTINGNIAGGIDYSLGTATIQNSIVANNTGGNCNGGVVSNGYNLSSDNTCNFHS